MTTLQTRECEYHPDVMEGREHLSTFITTEADESSDKFCPLRKFQPGTLPFKKNNESSHVKAELKASESEIHHRMETGDTASMQHHSYLGGTKPKSHSNEGGGSGSNSGSSTSKGQKQKSGSESGSSGHGSSSSSHHQSQQGGGMRGFGSSGDSDENDDDDKKRRPPRGLNKEPKSRVSFTEEDDEATDSADEGRSDEGMDFIGYAPVANKSSTFESGTSLRQTTPGTITVESVGPGIIGTTLLTGPQLGSPINMSVGYGVPETMAPRVIDKSPSGSGSRVGTPTLDSPRPSDGRVTPGTPELSPVIAPAPQQSSTTALTSVVASSIPTAGGSVQPSPSIPTGSFSLPFETAWGWQPQVYSPFPLTAGSHPGSLATTPAPTDSGPFLRPGTSIFLPATVCQESDGVLIVSVRWRNTTFSGSLIDMGQHEWAPPRLSCEPAVKVKDLYNSWQESENQQVNVDGEEDETKDNDNENEVKDITMATTETHSQPEGNATTKSTETGQKKQSSMETTSEAECSATRTEEDLPELVMKPRSRRESLTMLPKQPQQPESHYSDISDASDAEMELSEEKSVVTPQIPPTVLLPPLNGMFWPPAAARPVVKEQKTAPQDVHMQTQKQHHVSSLPTFSKIGESEDTMKVKSQPKHQGGINSTIPDSKPLSQKESPAAILRSNLLSSYPNTSTATPSEVTVSAPGQDHRHSVAVKTGVSANHASTSPHSTRTSTPPPSTRPGGIISNVQFSPLNTLVNVAVSMEPVTATSQDDTRKVPSPLKEKSRNRLNFDSMPPPQQVKPPPTTTTAKFVSIVDYATNDNKKSLKEDVPRSTSPRPESLMPDQRATQTRRSPSPSGFSKFKVQEGQFVGLPPFEDPPIVVKPKTAKATFGYGPPGVDPTVLVQSKDEGHDSDSSGSGSILHSSTSSQKRKGGRRKKRAEPLSVLKTDSTKIPKEEQGMKQPETPSLAPMTLGDFKLKIQPISPGIDVPPYHHHQHLSQKQPKDGNSSTGFPSPSAMPSLPPPQVGQPDAKKPTSRMTSSPKPIHTTTVGDMMKKIEPTLSGHHQQAFISTAIPQPPHKTGKPVTSTPSTSMLMAAEHDASLPHNNMLTKSQNQSMTAPSAGIPFTHVMLAPHHSPPISIQTHGSIVTPAVIQTPSGDSSKNEPRNTSIGASASGNINTAHSPRPGKTPGRKRKPGPDIQMEASKRSPPVREREESRELGPNILPPLPPSLLVNAKSQVSKQVLEEFMPPDEGKEKIKTESLPEGFDYDPYLPMSKELQLLSFENQQLARQKKFEYQQQQQHQHMAIEHLRKEEQSARMKAAKPRSRKQQKSSEISNPSHLGLPPSSSHILAVTSPPTPPQNKGLSRQVAHPALAQGSVITSQENAPQVFLTAGMMMPQVKSEPQSLKLSNSPGGKPPAASLSPKQPQPRKPAAKRPDPLQIKTEGAGEHLPQPALWPHMASHSFQHAAAFTPIQSTHAHSGSHSTSNATVMNMPPHGSNTIPISAHPLIASIATSSAHPWSTVVTSSATSTEKSTRQDHHLHSVPSVISTNEHPHHSSHLDKVSPKNKQDWHPSEGHGHSHGFTPVISSSSSHHVSGSKPTSAPPSSHSHHPQPAHHHHHHHHHRHQPQAAANGSTASNTARREGTAPSSSRHGSTFPTNTSSGEKQPHVHHHHHQSASSSTSSSSSSSHASLSSSQSSRSHNKPEQSASQLQQQQQHQAHAQQLQQLQQLQLSAMQQQLQLSPNAFAQRQQNGLPPNPAMMEEWMKQMQLMQMQYAELVKSGNIPSGTIPIAPSELQAAQQTQMAQMAAAAAAAQAQQVGIPVDPNMAMAALLYQQQQQQQQSAEALANLQAAGAQNMIHFMHPAMAPAAAHHPAALAGLYDPSLAFAAAAAGMVPFAGVTALPAATKREN